ncbi:sulfotransferase family protein [Rhodosalinus sediminis]|nr:sulfotransferase family protein [Rhodosalinus sediminis]
MALRNMVVFRRMEMTHANLNNSAAVAAFPELRVFFNRIKKSGNSTVTAFLAELAAEETGQRFGTVRDAKKAALSPVRCSWREAREMRDYTRFTVVRNPYDRVLSAFLNKVALGEEGSDSRKRRFRVVPGWGEATPDGFARFVAFLDERGLHHDRHWWPQRELLVMPPERFHLIGRLETLPEDMARLLTMIGRDPERARSLGQPHPLEASQPLKITGATAKRAAFYTPQLAQTVGRLYAADFETFGYPEDWA